MALITAQEKTNSGYSRQMPIRELDGAALQMAKNIFADYKQRGITINGSFEDMSWTLSNEARTVGLTLLTFDGGVKKTAMSWIGCTYRQFITSVKAYIVLNLGEMSLATLQELTRFFNRLAITKSEAVTDLVEYGRHIAYLLQLIPGGNERRDAVIEDLEEKLEQKATRWKDGKQRQLADFNSCAFMRFYPFCGVLLMSIKNHSTFRCTFGGILRRFCPCALWSFY